MKWETTKELKKLKKMEPQKWYCFMDLNKKYRLQYNIIQDLVFCGRLDYQDNAFGREYRLRQ